MLKARLLLIGFLAVGAILTAIPAHACDGENCNGNPIDRYQDLFDIGNVDDGELGGLITPNVNEDSSNFSAVRFSDHVLWNWDSVVTSSGAGVVGVEHSLQQANLNGGKLYQPCKNSADTYKGACSGSITAPTYWSTQNWTSSDKVLYPYGVIQYNSSNTQSCPSVTCQHGWANRAVRYDAEFYAKTGTVTNLNYVRPRMYIRSADLSYVSARNSYETVDWGNIPVPALGSTGTAKINGYVFTGGGSATVPENTLRFSIFQTGTDTNTPKTSTGKRLESFFAGGHKQGFWSTGGVFSGTFRVKIQDTRSAGAGSTAGKCYYMTISVASGAGPRVDFYIDRANLGRSGVSEVPCGG